MRNLSVALTLISALMATADAESFNRRLAQGQALLNTGDIEEAITIFRDLQVDDPESDTLHYDLGCAHYDKALQAARADALPEADDALGNAIAAFDEASTTPDRTLRRNAQYNKATALGQRAKQSMGAKDNDQIMAAFDEAVTAYEDFLRRYPDDRDAQTNLNHLRYELKKYLQQTPPPQEQNSQEGSQGENNESDPKNEEQKQQQGQDSQDQNQQEQQGQSGENQQDQAQQEEQKSASDEKDEAGQQEQQTADASAQEDETESNAQELEENRQNIEAILDSLQDTDEQQQRDMRRQPGRKGINSKWW